MSISKLESYFDEKMDTHVIDGIDGQAGWWHQAYYSRGWLEQNAFRLLSLAEEGKLTNIVLTWYERIAGADPVDSYGDSTPPGPRGCSSTSG